MGAILRDDAAEACVAVLTGEGHEGRTDEVTGRRAMTLAEMAAGLSRAEGREIATSTRRSRRPGRRGRVSGRPAWEAEGWITSYTVIACGELDLVTDDVERLTGQRPMDLAHRLGA